MCNINEVEKLKNASKSIHVMTNGRCTLKCLRRGDVGYISSTDDSFFGMMWDISAPDNEGRHKITFLVYMRRMVQDVNRIVSEFDAKRLQQCITEAEEIHALLEVLEAQSFTPTGAELEEFQDWLCAQGKGGNT